MHKKLLDILVCPLCKGKLIYESIPSASPDISSGSPLSESLVCRWDKLAYPIKDGIPVLIESEAASWPCKSDINT